MKKFEPLEDRVLVRVHKEEQGQKTEGGIITDPIQKPTQRATVVSVGSGLYARETGVFMPTVLAKGDVVLVPANHGMDIDTDEEKGLKLMREGDVLLFLEKKSVE